MKFKNPFEKIVPDNKLYKADIFCTDEQPEHEQLECGSENGGIVAIALLLPTVEVDINSLATYLEDPDWWTDRLENDSPQSAFIVLNTRGEKPAGTPTEEDGFGLVPTERTGSDHELTFDSLGVMSNQAFWAAVNRRRNWKMVYLTAGRDGDGNFEAFFVTNVSVFADEVIQRSTKTRKFYSGSAKWSTSLTPAVPFYAPASIFELGE
jgi:hypothetical protein